MTTAYTPILQLALPVVGELNGTWGTVVNNNITSMIEQAIAGLATINTWTTASHTLTTADGTTDEARCAVLECSGAPGAAATVVCPARTKLFVIKNSVTGGYAVTLKTSAGTGISVPNGSTALLYCDGTNVVSGATYMATVSTTQVDILAQGDLRLQDTTGGEYVALQAPATLTASYTLTMPADDGTAGQALATDGSGVLSWLTLAAPSVTYNEGATGAVTRTVQAKLQESVSVKDFGAAGDGVTDDGPAVQLAINAIAALGRGTVVFPAGYTYFLNTQINVCNNLVVMGYGARILAGTSWSNIDAPLFKNFTAAKMSIAPGTITATSNVSFYGLEFYAQDTGGAAGVANANMHGVLICMGNRTDVNSAVNGFTVQDCYLHDFNGAGVLTYGGQNINISNNRFVNFFVNTSLSIGSGLQLTDVDGFVVDSNVFNQTSANWSWHGMTILDFNTRSQNGVVSNNIIRNMTYGDGISCEGNGTDNIKNTTFVGNMISNCNGDGIGVDKCFQVVLSSNTIQNVVGVGFNIGQTENVIINANSLISVGSTAIYGSGDKITITGNYILGTTYVSATYQGDGILVVPTATSNVNSALISGNYLKDIAGCGIVAQQNTSIMGNFIYDAGQSASATRRQGIIAKPDSIVIGNTVQSAGNTTYGISCGDNPCTMSDNQLLGTFTSGKVFVGYRGAVSTSIVMNQNQIEMNGVTGNITAWDTTTPASGYWIKGDIFYNTAPAASGYIGWVCTTTPSTWKTWGAISA